MKNIEEYRKLFPVASNISYMNHAGVAPISSKVADALTDASNECLHWGATRYERLVSGIEKTRKSAARLVNADPLEIAFIKNTSEGISFIAQGFPWRPGDAVAVPEGEFPSNVYPWLGLKKRGVEVVRIKMRQGRLELDEFKRAISLPNVRMLAVSSVEFETGFRNNLALLGQLCRDRGIFFFVDAIQSLGYIPMNPAELGIHALAADAHKWLMGPEGIGILYVAKDSWDLIAPSELGWKSVVDPFEFSRINFELIKDASKFEPGSQSVIALHGLGAALNLLLEIGVDQIKEKVLENVGIIAEGLQRRGYEIFTSLRAGDVGGILTFAPKTEPANLAKLLLSKNVFTAARGPGLRISPHFYNNSDDISKFFNALDSLDKK